MQTAVATTCMACMGPLTTDNECLRCRAVADGRFDHLHGFVMWASMLMDGLDASVIRGPLSATEKQVALGWQMYAEQEYGIKKLINLHQMIHWADREVKEGLGTHIIWHHTAYNDGYWVAK